MVAGQLRPVLEQVEPADQQQQHDDGHEHEEDLHGRVVRHLAPCALKGNGMMVRYCQTASSLRLMVSDVTTEQRCVNQLRSAGLGAHSGPIRSQHSTPQLN